MIHGRDFRPDSGGVYSAMVDGGECALVYGATANLLAFVAPLVHRPTDATLPFAVLAQALVAVAVVAVSGGISAASRSLPSFAAGPAALTLIGLIMGYRLHEPALMAVSGILLGLLLVLARARPGADGRPGRRTNWTIGVAMAVAPFLAQPRPDRWSADVASAAALAAVALSAALIVTDRWQPSTRRPSHWRLDAALAALCLLGLAPGWLGHQSEPSLRIGARGIISTRPNVVLITLDTVRADHLSVYGYGRPTTPHLHEFLQDGAARYTRAFSTSDMTLSSHASIFTGLLPSDHGAHRRGSAPDTGLRPEVETLASRLRGGGFTTAGIAANTAYLSGRFGFDAGFDYYDVRSPPRLTAPFPSYFFGGQFVDRLLTSAGPELQVRYRSAADIVRQGKRLLPPLKSAGQPFFLFLNLMDAHVPIIPPATYRRAFGVNDRGSYWLRDYDQLSDGVNGGTRAITDAERAHLVASYDAAIASMDAELGRLFEELKRLDLFERSLIIVTSDHGELFGRSGAFGHDGIGIAPGLFRVPLLVKYPHGFRPADTDRPVSGVDLYPTILDLAGIPSGRGEGRSLLTPVPSDRPLFFESFESAWLAALHPRFRGDERAALIGDRLIVDRSRGLARGEWRVTSLPASDTWPDANLAHAYSVLRHLETVATADSGRPMPSRAVLDRLRSVGYFRQ